jgi:hypothetical protein
VADRAELIEQLQHDLHREVAVMDDAPDHHAGMYMMAAGDGRMIVGDPSLGASLLAADASSLAPMEGGPDFSERYGSRRIGAVQCLFLQGRYSSHGTC